MHDISGFTNMPEQMFRVEQFAQIKRFTGE
jgi:hypothetical protein